MAASRSLPQLLKMRRRALGLSRRAVAEATGIPVGTLEGWERGRVGKPPIHDVFRVATLLGIGTEELRAAVVDPADEPHSPVRADGPSAPSRDEQEGAARPIALELA